MDLRAYINALGRSWLLIAVLALVGGGVGFGADRTTPATYASTVTFYVSTPVSDAANPQSAGQFAENRVSSYALLLESDRLADRVAQQTGRPVDEVAGAISASAETSTVLVTATITDSSAARAGELASSVASAFPSMVNELDNQGSDRSTVEINVVSGPTAASQISPSLKKYLVLGLGAGLAVGAIAALLRELLDVTVRTSDVASSLVPAPVIGTVDRDKTVKKSPLPVGDTKASTRAESIRQLRTNLNYIGSVDPTNVLVVTSSVPFEGKSTVAADLALALVESGNRVMLIDGDLRRPRIAEIFGLERSAGLTDVLIGRASVAEVTQPWGANGPDVLASGDLPPNPIELLGAPAMARLMRSLRDSYDKIIIDAPPVLPVADALVASDLADGVLFVIRHGKTTRATVKAAGAALQAVNARVVGSVLNMRRTSRRARRLYGTTGYTSKVVATGTNRLVVQPAEDAKTEPGEVNGFPLHAAPPLRVSSR